MKNIIPGVVLAIGMIGSPALAEEKEIHKNSTQPPVQALAKITGEKVNASLQPNDNQRNEAWRQNAERFVTGVLPGNPVSRFENGVQVIGYEVGSSDNRGTRIYVGAYRNPSDGGNTRYGLVVNIPFGK